MVANWSGQSTARKSDATDRVRIVLSSVVGKSLSSRALINEIADELYTLQTRVKHVQSISKDLKSVDLSPYVQHLIKMVGKEVIVEPCDLPKVAVG